MARPRRPGPRLGWRWSRRALDAAPLRGGRRGGRGHGHPLLRCRLAHRAAPRPGCCRGLPERLGIGDRRPVGERPAHWVAAAAARPQRRTADALDRDAPDREWLSAGRPLDRRPGVARHRAADRARCRVRSPGWRLGVHLRHLDADGGRQPERPPAGPAARRGRRHGRRDTDPEGTLRHVRPHGACCRSAAAGRRDDRRVPGRPLCPHRLERAARCGGLGHRRRHARPGDARGRGLRVGHAVGADGAGRTRARARRADRLAVAAWRCPHAHELLVPRRSEYRVAADRDGPLGGAVPGRDHRHVRRDPFRVDPPRPDRDRMYRVRRGPDRRDELLHVLSDDREPVGVEPDHHVRQCARHHRAAADRQHGRPRADHPDGRCALHLESVVAIDDPGGPRDRARSRRARARRRRPRTG